MAPQQMRQRANNQINRNYLHFILSCLREIFEKKDLIILYLFIAGLVLQLPRWTRVADEPSAMLQIALLLRLKIVSGGMMQIVLKAMW